MLLLNNYSMSSETQQVEQLAVGVYASETVRQVVKHVYRASIWLSRNSNYVKSTLESRWLARERKILVMLREALLKEHGDRMTQDSLPDMSDF